MSRLREEQTAAMSRLREEQTAAMSRLREEQTAAMSRLREEQTAAMSRLREEQKRESRCAKSRQPGHRGNRPANARSGRSALVTMPGAASTTARMAFSAGIPVTVIAIAPNAAADEKSVPGFGKIRCLL